MPDEEAELAELRRRAYGPGADLAGDPGALARLAELEAARRPAAAEQWGAGDGRAPGDRAADGGGPEIGVPPDPSGNDDPPTGEAAPDDRAPVSRRWFASALVATSAIAAIVVMLVAGAFGWGGGYLAGWVGAAQPADHGMHLEDVLEEQELPADVSEAPWMQMIVDPETGETMGDIAYFGEFESGLHVSVRDGAWGRGDDVVGDRVCVQLFQVTPTDENGTSTWGTGACGSARTGVRFEAFVAASFSGSGDLPLAGFAPGTLLRFIYDDATETVSVWSLPPEEETDPTA